MACIIVHHPGRLKRITIHNRLPQLIGTVVLAYANALFNKFGGNAWILLRKGDNKLLKLVGNFPKVVPKEFRQES